MTQKITLDKIKLRGSRAVVEISSLDEPLILDIEAAHRHQLTAGTVITPAQVAELEEESARFQCREDATRLLAMRQHSVGELRLKLRRKGHDRAITDDVVRSFKRQGILDDAQYAQLLAEQLISRKPCGKGYLMAHLQRRQIDRSLAEDVAAMVLSDYRYEDLALQALRRRWPGYAKFDLETARRKAYTYLARRGFTHEAARAAFDQLTQEETDGGTD
jgi:regulatory protein